MTAEQELKTRLKALDQKRIENSMLEGQAAKEEDLMVKDAENMQVSIESLTFLEEVANSRRGSMKGKIESVLTEALQLVYGPERSIELVYSVKNNRSHLSFEIIKKTTSGDVRRVLDGTGAGLGVSDTVSVPLRLLVLLGSKQADKVCILDECYKHVNVERVPIVSQFLRVLTERLGMQVIILSHHESVRAYADASYEVKEGVNASTVTRV